MSHVSKPARLALAVLVVVAGLATAGVVRNTRAADAAPAPADLTDAVRSLMGSLAGNPAAYLYNDHVEYPTQTAAEGIEVARTLDGRGGYVITVGSGGRLGFYAHRRDGGIRAAFVPGRLYDAWRRRGAERGVGYPLGNPDRPYGDAQTRCPAGTEAAQPFARLYESTSRPRLACATGDRVTWVY